jgi:hypothetical protein
VAPTQAKHLTFNLIIKPDERIHRVELTQDVYGFAFELSAECAIVFLVYLPRLKIKLEITDSRVQHLFLEH